MNDVVDRQFIVWRDRAEAAEAKLAAALIRIEALEAALHKIDDTSIDHVAVGIARAALNQQTERQCK